MKTCAYVIPRQTNDTRRLCPQMAMNRLPLQSYTTVVSKVFYFTASLIPDNWAQNDLTPQS